MSDSYRLRAQVSNGFPPAPESDSGIATSPLQIELEHLGQFRDLIHVETPHRMDSEKEKQLCGFLQFL